jgi:hypothetical protein
MSEYFLTTIAILNTIWIIKDFTVDRRNRKTIEDNLNNKDREISYHKSRASFLKNIFESAEQGKLKGVSFDLDGNMGFIFEKKEGTK